MVIGGVVKRGIRGLKGNENNTIKKKKTPNMLNDFEQCVNKLPQDGSLANFGYLESCYPLLQLGGGVGRSDF